MDKTCDIIEKLFEENPENWDNHMWTKDKDKLKKQYSEKKYKELENKINKLKQQYNIEKEKLELEIKKKKIKKSEIHSLDKSCVPNNLKVPFKNRTITLNDKDVDSIIDFSYNIKVKDTRSGGSDRRNNYKKIFNNIQGKLGEVIAYKMIKNKEDFEPLDFECYPLGIWDNHDILSLDKTKNISVKTALSFGNLLLLTKDDYNSNGDYKHHPGDNYLDEDFVLVRIKLDRDTIIKKLNSLPKAKNLFINWFKTEYKSMQYDIHHCNKKTLKKAIDYKNIIRKGEKLNGIMPMDADNYYLLLYDMVEINSL